MFAALFGILYLLTFQVFGGSAFVISAIGAAVIALCISYIFLKPLRDRVGLEVVHAREASGRTRVKSGSDEDVEDQA